MTDSDVGTLTALLGQLTAQRVAMRRALERAEAALCHAEQITRIYLDDGGKWADGVTGKPLEPDVMIADAIAECRKALALAAEGEREERERT